MTYRVQKEQGTPGYTTTPMGRPIGNTQVYLLDKYQQPVPIGVSGELYIGGASVARGYLNRPELTAEKFIADPFNTELGARLYRTGDLARFLLNGTIEFQGRIDDQVKIRGYRIELGEIQETLSNHPAVRTALVVVREDVPGDKRLVAYVVLHEGQTTTAADLQSHMMKHVPNYMIPSAFMLLEAFPLMPNGKVDRRALLAPDYSHRELEPGFLAPQTPLQEAVAASWSKVLGIEQIGIYDDFFTLGGHSLLAMQVISHLRTTLQLELPLRSFFEAPTIEHLADALLKEGDTHEKEETDSRAKVVTIQAGGARRPFFYLHGDWLGGGLYCLGLTESLSKDQPFYTLEPYRFDGLQIPPTLEAMAAAHIEAMRTVQPEGPYLLGGWCNGGLIAYEMARQLKAAGQAVDLLVVIDMGTPYSHKLNRKVISRIGNLFGLGQEKQLNWFLRYIYLRIPSFRKRIQEDAGLKITKQAESGRKMGFAFSKFKSIFPTIEALRYNWFGIFRWIKAGYEPGRYSGKLTLFWSDEADPHDIDWRKLSGAKEVEDHFFPGTHVMYRNENLSVLAECLDTCLIEAQATESSARS
jgi:hypothetical protein